MGKTPDCELMQTMIDESVVSCVEHGMVFNGEQRIFMVKTYIHMQLCQQVRWICNRISECGTVDEKRYF